MDRLLPYVLVAAGSMAGGLARYAAGRGLAAFGGRFPLSTLAVNLSGSFLMGILGGVLAHRPGPHADAWRLALGTGFCGGFTTFSAFEAETQALLVGGHKLAAASYVVSSVVGGLVAFRLGWLTGKVWF
jgi:CrcB protein